MSEPASIGAIIFDVDGAREEGNGLHASPEPDRAQPNPAAVPDFLVDDEMDGGDARDMEAEDQGIP